MPDLLLGGLLGAFVVSVGFLAAYFYPPVGFSPEDGGPESPGESILPTRSDVLERIRDLEASQDRLRQETEATLDKIRAAENRIHHKMDRLRQREEDLEAEEMGEMREAVEAQIAENIETEGGDQAEPTGEVSPEVAAFLARRQ